MLAKKFQPLSAYEETEKKGYQLLPFNFINWRDNKYILTNFSGEHTIVPRDQLEEFVRHELPCHSDLYLTLKSKHFLYDCNSNVPIDLLALKTRTKLAPQANFTSLHLFVVTLRCDYSCPYCQVSRQTEDKDAFDMSEATAMRALDFTFQSPSPAIKIEFQGGESLLNFPLIQKVVLEAEKRNEIEKRDLQFVIATNLSPLNDEIINFCLHHEVYLSTSLDGPESLHNKNRPRPGRNGHELTVKGIQRVRKDLGSQYISALMTTTKDSLDNVQEIVDEYIRLGFSSIFLRPLSPYGFAITTRQTEKYDTEQWIEFYKRGLNYILDINRSGYPFTEHYTAIILRKILTPFSTNYVDLQSPAGVGISAVVYNYDGDVYASDEARMLAEMNDKSFRLGNLHENSYEEIFLSDNLLNVLESSLLESIPSCTDCGFRNWCGADPVYHYATQNDFVGNKAESGFCTKNMAIFRHIIELLESDSQTNDILRSWITPC